MLPLSNKVTNKNITWPSYAGKKWEKVEGISSPT